MLCYIAIVIKRRSEERRLITHQWLRQASMKLLSYPPFNWLKLILLATELMKANRKGGKK